MISDNVQFPYAVEITADPDLNTTVIALSYTDPRDRTRNLLACIAPELGSNLYRLKAGDHELFHYDIQKLQNRGHTGNFVLWPFPNRVRDQRYFYHSQQYNFTGIERVQSALIHGLVYDCPWAYNLPAADLYGASVTTSIEMNPEHPYYGAYPFISRLALTYTLTSTGVSIAYAVQNKGTSTLPYGFAQHPYFNLLAGAEQTLVTLYADRVMEADAEMLPTGRVLDVHSTMYAMFDLNQPMPVGHLKLDHVYTGLPGSREAMIDYRGFDLSVRITASEDFTHSVIYTPAHEPYFCLENQTCSTDAINLQRLGMQDIAHLIEVQPGGQASGEIRYIVEHK